MAPAPQGTKGRNETGFKLWESMPTSKPPLKGTVPAQQADLGVPEAATGSSVRLAQHPAQDAEPGPISRPTSATALLKSSQASTWPRLYAGSDFFQGRASQGEPQGAPHVDRTRLLHRASGDDTPGSRGKGLGTSQVLGP